MHVYFFLILLNFFALQGLSAQSNRYYDPSSQVKVNYHQNPENRSYQQSTKQQQSYSSNDDHDDNDKDDKDDRDDNDLYDDDDDDQDDHSHPSSSPKEDQNRQYRSSTSSTTVTTVTQQPTSATERTFTIIKPDGVKNRHIGDIISRYEDAGLKIVAIKMIKIDRDQATQFYKAHRNRPFFKDLIDLMTSGPSVVLVVEGKNAINKNRELMGATDPNQAKQGTIRSDLAESTTRNVIHGSDSPESAREEIFFFFKPAELYNVQ